MKGNAYKDSGVDTIAGATLVDRIKGPVSQTNRPGVMSGLGAFGAFFDLSQVQGYNNRVLMSSTDGVGTKLKIALQQKSHDTIGVDCVAMCVNDIAVHGGEPLFFLDYFATGHLDVDVAEQVIKGVAQGCMQAGCALVGGETAEMPGVYRAGDYDLAGFTVGCVEKDKIVDGTTVAPGDKILGLASNGLHSNGFSLVRKIIEERPDLSYDKNSYFTEGCSLGEFLLTPTRIYVKPVLAVLQDAQCVGGVHAMAHITGGGLPENMERVIPDNMHAAIDVTGWDLPPVFSWLKEMGQLRDADLLHTFNCGIGLTVVCDAAQADNIKAKFEETGEQVFEIGEIREGAAGASDTTGQDASAQNEKVHIYGMKQKWN